MINGNIIKDFTAENLPLIAIIDSGVDVDNNYFCLRSINQIILDEGSICSRDHGTKVDGLITANGDGIHTPRGLIPNTKLLSIQIGNDYPSAYDSVIAVSTLKGQNYEIDPRTNYDSDNIFAPGNFLLTTGSFYKDMDWFSGSSAAAPLVTSIVAYILLKNPHLTPDQVKKILLSSATKVQLETGEFINILNIEAALVQASIH